MTIINIRPRFYAVKNADQTSFPDAVATKVTFQTETYDIGNFFASSAWTPPAGIVMVGGALYWSAPVACTASTVSIAFIYKNGAVLYNHRMANYSNFAAPIPVAGIDKANGTDFYEMYGYFDNNGTTSLSATTTNFWGEWVGP